MEIAASTIVQRRADVLAADVGGEIVLMSVERGKYFGLDEVGSEIWRAIEAPTDVAALCNRLLRNYDGLADVVERDVIALLHQLLEHDLIQPAR